MHCLCVIYSTVGKNTLFHFSGEYQVIAQMGTIIKIDNLHLVTVLMTLNPLSMIPYCTCMLCT